MGEPREASDPFPRKHEPSNCIAEKCHTARTLSSHMALWQKCDADADIRVIIS